ncbi:MAG: MarR family transcriptional regulator [Dehalococcoidia bacterium]|jgi:predicted transcriptional regulator|uniref:helix-turn-helix transcriptional regulator n=1 Tax=Candidatus Amarobacter glycogenicus TaxID=3140699 RepID=UPI001D25EA81|nr:MarR family transcriptional regulator [Dehalococcoidia bacterium]MBK6562836.1 MarR family transcriptional regulator [Dehalococcoidia bacterium]MBK7126368.1 MarR family transcriptional regulator [Dehalococcoidia bacterium]MBK7330797.1 MarR family transcriptional regulator [Dehalococcoidia bacterium]MBK7726670.1 MarR family transcriptional regulator [Dehalococcoidia bacterium]
MSDWTFLTNHSHVLLCIAQNPQVRLSEIAERVGVKERTVFGIVSDLVEAGYLSKVRNGRRNVYVVHPELHLRHPLERETEIRVLLSIVHAGGQPRIPVEGAP